MIQAGKVSSPLEHAWQFSIQFLIDRFLPFGDLPLVHPSYDDQIGILLGNGELTSLLNA